MEQKKIQNVPSSCVYPPEPDMGLHWDDREPCPFSREEGEAFCTYVASDMSRCHPKRRK